MKEMEHAMKELQVLDTRWEHGKASKKTTKGRRSQERSHGSKRLTKGEGADGHNTRPPKKRKFDLLSKDWGMKTTT